MAVAPTYPGVYIEEIPSGVHTITGVATSITAFVGFTARGNVDVPVHIFSFADFERAFGGLSVDSPLSYSVKQFFQNGGTEAYVVRVANNAPSATVTLQHENGPVLIATANGAGTWGNNLQLEVDYDTANPASMFNLRVTELVSQNGQMVPARTEMFRNLTLNNADGSYVVAAVNATSDLIRLATTGAAVTGQGVSASGVISAGDLTAFGALTQPAKLGVVLNGLPPFEIDLAANSTTATIRVDIVGKINAQVGPNSVTGASTASSITITSGENSAKSAVHFLNATTNNAAVALHLGIPNGGTETDGAAAFRPVQSGTSGVVTLPLSGATGTLIIDVKRGTVATALRTISVDIWGVPPLPPLPTTIDELVVAVRNALTKKVTSTPPEPYLAGATVRRAGNQIQIVPGLADPNISFDFANTTPPALLTDIALNGATSRNVARYAPGVGLTAFAQTAGLMGGNGSPPSASDLQGSQSAKTGMYALEGVDLFNLLVMPDTAKAAGLFGVLTEAIAYCERRRAFMIIDVPETSATSPKPRRGSARRPSPLRSRNSAIFFPRLREPDPMMGNIVGRSPRRAPSPACTPERTPSAASGRPLPEPQRRSTGAVGLSYVLTDAENGTLEPARPQLPAPLSDRRDGGVGRQDGQRRRRHGRRVQVHPGPAPGPVPRGEPVSRHPVGRVRAERRTAVGPDPAEPRRVHAHPVRPGRLPGQAPPREAYFVKCDKETTTQNDIDLGSGQHRRRASLR